MQKKNPARLHKPLTVTESWQEIQVFLMTDRQKSVKEQYYRGRVQSTEKLWIILKDMSNLWMNPMMSSVWVDALFPCLKHLS